MLPLPRERDEKDLPRMIKLFGKKDDRNAAPEPAPENGLFKRLRQGLSKTRSALSGRLDRLFLGRKEITDDLLEELEEILFTSDIGVRTTQQLVDSVQEKVKRKELNDPIRLKAALRDHMLSFLNTPPPAHPLPGPGEPLVIMVIGVNGVGKTTTIGKSAARFRDSGKRVMLVAADTFRAAAVEQLAIWGERVGADVVKQETGADPSAVVFDALDAALSRKTDVVLIDTAGRLHTKKNLMEELQKIRRVAGRKLPGAPHQVWLVLDATTGQNAISQAEIFHHAIGVTDIVLTKLDGTAKGGIVVGIARELRIPIRYIGIGEKVEDLRPFDAEDFVRAIFL
ncbi:MAG: signal recognition particle-docking protein FtsY [Deltaproteobacteria bacterium]|nr:MAG: signal recognition particle-docking protein FtsY [Deltaproteobacteria bacterium]